jgi:hypothetical protein
MREKEKEAATSIDGTHPHNGIDHIPYILSDLAVDAIDLQSRISGRCCFSPRKSGSAWRVMMCCLRSRHANPARWLWMTAPDAAKVQRAQNGMITGACIKLSADDIVFVDSTVEFLEIHRKHSGDGIVLVIRRAEP